MEDKKEQVPEYLLRLMVLRFLDSEYPAEVHYLEEEMGKASCTSRRLARILTYLREKGYVEGSCGKAYATGLTPRWITVKITAKGIDYLDEARENIKLEVEEKEREIGFRPYSQQRKKQ